MTDRQKRDLAMMKDSMQWPNLVLPLVRSIYEEPHTGYLRGNGPKISLGNVWAMSANDPVKEYDSFEAIIADGWRVD